MQVIRLIPALGALCLGLLALSACTNDVGGERPADRAMPSEQALHSGSCEGFCGGLSADGCWCDAECVAWGDCCADYEPVCTAPPACESDADCPGGYCEGFVSCLGLDCPPPPPNQCVFPSCDDGTVPVCEIVPPTCDVGQVLAARDGCFVCVDARTCEPPAPSCTVSLLCVEGTHAADTDGDGCEDACIPDEQPAECTTTADCPAGHACNFYGPAGSEECCPPNALCDASIPVCETGVCEPVVCPAVYPTCPEGQEPADVDGDGCAIECAPTTTTCTSDADCANGYCESFATCMAIGCPPPPPNQCVFPSCDDGSALTCTAEKPACAAGETAAVRDGCWQCLDARSCALPPPPPPSGECTSDAQCGDGQYCAPIQCITAPCPPGLCTDVPADSCRDRCGEQAPGGCWCDESCAAFGDCCADVEQHCSAQ